MRRSIALLWLQALIVALVVLSQIPARAHAVLVESSPRDNASVKESPKRVVLRFDAKIEKKVTQITLLDAKGDKVALPKPPHGYGGTPDQLVIPLPKLRPGAYQLRYQVMATDGHISPGLIRFTVAAKGRG